MAAYSKMPNFGRRAGVECAGLEKKVVVRSARAYRQDDDVFVRVADRRQKIAEKKVDL